MNKERYAQHQKAKSVIDTDMEEISSLRIQIEDLRTLLNSNTEQNVDMESQLKEMNEAKEEI